MLYFVLGLPGNFAAWCDDVVAQLAAKTAGSSELIHAESLAEISRKMIGNTAGAVVVAARQPGGRLRAALIERGRDFVVALEDPRSAVAHLVLEQGVEFAAAVKVVASSCGAAVDSTSAPRALLLIAGDHQADPVAAASSIARHLDFAAGEVEIGEIIRVPGAEGSWSERPEIAFWWNKLDRNRRETAEGALGPYISYFKDGDLLPLRWASELFFLGDRPAERATDIIDITGRSRCLLHGPYIMLPAGFWGLSFRAFFSREAAEHDFSLEVLAGKQLASRSIRPRAEGIFEVDLTFVVDGLSDHPIDIRLSMERSAFDGALRLAEVVVNRQTEVMLAPVAVAAAI